jgi:hypothetical protein
MVVFSLNRRAIPTFFGSPFRRRRNFDSFQFNRFNSAATIRRAFSASLSCRSSA